MRKRIIGQVYPKQFDAAQNCLDLNQLAEVELTSEDVAHPIESALFPGTESGWRAAVPGEQTIRLLFDAPQTVRKICLMFCEAESERTQELVLRWSPDQEQPYREILRQRYNFSPPHTTREIEDYGVELEGVMRLELSISPDVSGGAVCASLEQLRLA